MVNTELSREKDAVEKFLPIAFARLVWQNRAVGLLQAQAGTRPLLLLEIMLPVLLIARLVGRARHGSRRKRVVSLGRDTRAAIEVFLTIYDSLEQFALLEVAQARLKGLMTIMGHLSIATELEVEIVVEIGVVMCHFSRRQ